MLSSNLRALSSKVCAMGRLGSSLSRRGKRQAKLTPEALTPAQAASAHFIKVEQTGGLPTRSAQENTLSVTDTSLTTVHYALRAPLDSDPRPVDIRPLILHEDSHMLILFKPPTVEVNPGGMVNPDMAKGAALDNLLGAGKLYLQQEYAKPSNAFLAPCHFIDKPCSGILVTAKKSKSASRIHKFFSERHKDLHKEYVCVVRGHVHVPARDPAQLVDTTLAASASADGQSRRLRHYLVSATKGELTRTRRRVFVTGDVDDSSRQIRPSEVTADLEYRVVRHFDTPRDGKLSLLRVRLHTGRKHQIRAQLAHVGHPIHMDTQYEVAGMEMGAIPKKIPLHAFKLSLPHPAMKGLLDRTPTTHVRVRCGAPDFWGALYGQGVVAAVERLCAADEDEEEDVWSRHRSQRREEAKVERHKLEQTAKREDKIDRKKKSSAAVRVLGKKARVKDGRGEGRAREAEGINV